MERSQHGCRVWLLCVLFMVACPLSANAGSYVYQAEDHTASDGCRFVSGGSWSTGAGYMDYGGAGSWIEWDNVNVAEAGDYSLTFFYTNGSSGRSSEVLIDQVSEGVLPFAKTGSWETLDTDSLIVTLAQGSHAIRVMAATSNGGPNLDRMEISTVEGIVTELQHAMSALDKYIEGTLILNQAQLAQHKMSIDDNIQAIGLTDGLIAASFDLVENYERRMGPLFMNEHTKSWKRSEFVPDIHTAMLSVMQGIMDFCYTSKNLSRYEDLLSGFKFRSSEYFPGPVDPPVDSDATHTVTINGSYVKTFGHLVMHAERPARKPTGTYLAPGTIATVTVPQSMVGKGYQVRVGAHSWDFSNKPWVKRLDRSTLVYDIDSAEKKIASPLGGGIYIEVPYLADAGVVDVHIRNAVRSPFYSAKSFHRTSLWEWQQVERQHQAPWADFQTDKFMMQVPTSWIYDLEDPSRVLQDWDSATDVVSDLMGYPHVRGKETLYLQIDVMIRASAYSPGYPQVNATYNPRKTYDGDKNHYFLTGPQHSPAWTLHEMGHGQLFQKLPGETEAAVNLLYVAVMHQAFGMSLDEAFYRSRRYTNAFLTLDHTAITWMTCENFKLEKPMVSAEMQYQLKGHARYVEIARLFGWEALNRYWYSINEDYENQIDVDTHVDALILRLCKAVGVDVSPLLHFWGRPPENSEDLKLALAQENLPSSAAIYDLLVRYKSAIPVNNGAFREFAVNWWKNEPESDGYMTERYHAELLDLFDEAYAADIQGKVQNIIDLNFEVLAGPR